MLILGCAVPVQQKPDPEAHDCQDPQGPERLREVPAQQGISRPSQYVR